jgi:hypothetical protein
MQQSQKSMNWLFFALLTVVSWGVYGVFLHIGQTGMNVPGAAPDPNARYKAFLFVGIAYFLVAVLAPVVVLKMNNATWSFPAGGSWWSLIAGVVGAIGAFGVLLAFGAQGKPPEVMAIVFAGAPVVNAVVALWISRKDVDWNNVSPLFYIGIILALVGGGLVTLKKPASAPHGAPKVASSATAAK